MKCLTQKDHSSKMFLLQEQLLSFLLVLPIYLEGRSLEKWLELQISLTSTMQTFQNYIPQGLMRPHLWTQLKIVTILAIWV